MDNSRPHAEQGTTGDPRAEIAALIARLEKATGPDREIDHAIDQAVNGEWHYYASQYTASLDAALTLVPEGYSATINTFCWVEVFPKDVTLQADTYAKHVRHSQLPAIALCIAALKARAAIASLGSPVANSPSNEADVVHD